MNLLGGWNMSSYLHVKPILEKNLQGTLERLGIQPDDRALTDYSAHLYSTPVWHFVTHSRDTLLGMIGIRSLKWDSDIYGINIASFGMTGLASDILENQKREICLNLIKKAKKFARSEGIDMLVCRVPLVELAWFQALEKAGFLTMDVQCPLVCTNPQDVSVSKNSTTHATIREAQPEDAAQVINFGKSAFGRSHLYADQKLSVDLSNKLHEEWLRNDITGSRAKFTYVAEVNGEVGGFISALWDDDQQRLFGTGHGHIDLIAVRSGLQGKGLGSLLFSTAMERFVKDGASVVTVSTQATNLDAIRLYQRNRFKFAGFEVTLHCWPDYGKNSQR
jgi:ribosomal protein S18 acetylase RimI-like enzyme